MHAYCLFCETQKCATVALLVERKYNVRCISPVIIQRKWVKGNCEEKQHKWLPGYVFLYTDIPIKEKFWIPGIIRWLGDGELRHEDKSFAQMIFDNDGVLGTLKLAEVGDRCVIDNPLWQNMEGRVVKVDRGRKRCCVEFLFDGVKRSVWLGYEMVRMAKQEREG